MRNFVIHRTQVRPWLMAIRCEHIRIALGLAAGGKISGIELDPTRRKDELNDCQSIRAWRGIALLG
jgi:hypothetical protein